MRQLRRAPVRSLVMSAVLVMGLACDKQANEQLDASKAPSASVKQPDPDPAPAPSEDSKEDSKAEPPERGAEAGAEPAPHGDEPVAEDPPSPPPFDANVELPDEPAAKIRAAADLYRQWAEWSDGTGLPSRFFREGEPTAIATEYVHDDEGALDRTNLTGHAAVQAWLEDKVSRMPGTTAGVKINSCNDAGCCIFSDASSEAEDGNLPSEIVELRAVCFDLGEDGSLHTKRMKYVFY